LSRPAQKNEINIAKHLEKFQRVLGETKIPVLAILSCIPEITVEIKSALMSQENLAKKNDQIPILECNSAECYMWTIAILASAWTEWVFAAKTNNPKYQDDPEHLEASVNVKLALPYIMRSIDDALKSGHDIGTNAETDYNPNSDKCSVKFTLRKE
jgi:hypothetical protein